MIVNTASVSGLAGDYGLGAYNAVKAAVVQYDARDRHRVRAQGHPLQRASAPARSARRRCWMAEERAPQSR